MPRVVFIASLPKSGSTLLDLLLGTHPNVVGLGEIYQLIRTDSIFLRNNRDELCACSCGAPMSECRFWSGVVRELQASPELSVIDRYLMVLRHLANLYGNDVIAVDSSKNSDALQIAYGCPSLDIRIVTLIRDVRAWTTSRLAKEESARIAELKTKGFVESRSERRSSGFSLFRSWYSENSRLLIAAKEAGHSTKVSYEQLCLDTDQTMKQLLRFIGTDPTQRLDTISNSRSHNILGNRMKFQVRKRSNVGYDIRWMAETCWLWPSLVFPHIMAFNRQQVYPPEFTSLWSR